jgi:hypothetical protein
MQKVTEEGFLLEDKLSLSEIENVVLLWYTRSTGMVFITNYGREIDEIIEDDGDFKDDQNVIENYDLSQIDVYYLIKYWYETIYVGRDKLYAKDFIELNDFCTYKMVQIKLEV